MIGNVYRCRVDGVDHPKRFIVVGTFGEKAAIIYINKNPSYNGLYIPIDSTDYSFIEYKSYIICSTIFEKEISSIRSQIGKVPSELMDTIKKTLRKADGIEPHYIKKYGV